MNRINSLKYELRLNFNNEKDKNIVYKKVCYGCLVKTKCITLIPHYTQEHCLRIFHGCESLLDSVQQIPFDNIRGGCMFQIKETRGSLRVRRYELERGENGLIVISNYHLETVHKQM